MRTMEITGYIRVFMAKSMRPFRPLVNALEPKCREIKSIVVDKYKEFFKFVVLSEKAGDSVNVSVSP